MKEGIPLHFTSAVIAGFCTTLVASPVDVVKTRYMNSPKGAYKGAVDCAVRMGVQEGFRAFYKGYACIRWIFLFIHDEHQFNYARFTDSYHPSVVLCRGT